MQIWLLLHVNFFSQLTRLSAEEIGVLEVAKEKLWPRMPFLQDFLPAARGCANYGDRPSS